MSWIQTVGKLPDTDRAVIVQGTMTTQAKWNQELQSWQIVPDANINCEVNHWKEIENGSTEGQSVCQGTDQS